LNNGEDLKVQPSIGDDDDSFGNTTAHDSPLDLEDVTLAVLGNSEDITLAGLGNSEDVTLAELGNLSNKKGKLTY
jgi:hypothetical protein